MNLVQLGSEKHMVAIILPIGATVQGEFALQGGKTRLRLFPSAELDPADKSLGHLSGTLADGTRLSFINCGTTGRGHWYRSGSMTFYHDLCPHFVALGHAYLTEATLIGTISILVGDAADIFYDFDAFGHAHGPRDQIASLIEAQPRAMRRNIKIGDDPLVAYFTGKSSIVSVDTILGKVSADHRISYSAGAARGIAIDSETHVRLDLDPPAPLQQAYERLLPVLRFLELVAGRPQAVLGLHVLLDGADAEPQLELYRCRKQVGSNRRTLSPADLPVNGGMDPSAFTRVLREWISKDASRLDCRVRFSSCFSKQNRYDIDRIVGAANMFDIMPAEAVPREAELDPDVAATRDEARQAFRKLAPSEARDTILGALGRLGRSALKRKVRHRAAIITAVVPRLFPDLAMVTDAAIDCRNHYVHGGNAKMDYMGENADLIPFLTDTLEFVFAASEFVESGWDAPAWAARGTAMSHPWGAYLANYQGKLAAMTAPATRGQA